MKKSCEINASEDCQACTSALRRVCLSVPIAQHILGSDDAMKIRNLIEVMEYYNFRVSQITGLERGVKIKYYLCNKLTVDRECEVCNCCKLKPVPRRAKCQN